MTEIVEQAAAPKKAATVVTQVTMTDGRVVPFAGKRKMVKTVDITDGRLSVRFDFVNGETRTFTPPDNLILNFAGHGASQKIGDEAAGVEDIDDIILATDAIIERLNNGEWGAARAAGDGFSGANVVIRAIMEATGKDQVSVKAFLQGKLDKAKEAGEILSRQALYQSFRRPGSKTGVIIERIEKEKATKSFAADADSLLEEMAV